MVRAGTVAAAIGATLVIGCGGTNRGSDQATNRTADSSGDPFVTDAQVHAVRAGEPESQAFKELGGRSPSGYNGQQAGPRRTYDYPIRGTGSTEVGVEEGKEATWWELCMERGRVVGKERGKLGSLSKGCTYGGAPPTQEEQGLGEG